MTLLQWVSAVLKKLRTPSILKPAQEPPVGDTWAQYYAYLAPVLTTKEAEGSVMPQKTRSTVVTHLDEEHAMAITDYYARAESILRSYDVAPQTPQSGETSTAQTSRQKHDTPQGTGYLRHIKYGTVRVPAHLKVLYDELYEACWTGDNAAIQELCLPKHIKESKEPIQISVVTTASILSHFTGMLLSIFS